MTAKKLDNKLADGKKLNRTPSDSDPLRRVQTSIRMTVDAKTLAGKLGQKLGLNQQSVIEMAIRDFAEKHGVKLKG